MKYKIYGRKAGSKGDMTLLIASAGVSTGDRHNGAAATDELAVASARRAVQILRDYRIEGYIVFERDPAHYEFSLNNDFVYPALIH